VLTALSIFLVSLIVIGQLVSLSGQRALEVRHLSEAAQLAQSKMAEVVAGAVPLESQGDASFEETPDWHWSMEAEQASVPSLWHVRITVSRQRPDGSKIETTLTQLVLDPAQRGSTLDSVAPSVTGSTDTGGGSSTSSQTSSGSSSSSGTTQTSGSATSGGGAPRPGSGSTGTSSSGASKGGSGAASPGASKGGSAKGGS
jgi:hypothetical protein